MATSGQKSRTGAKSSGNRSSQRRRPHQDETGIIPVLARVVRGIENAADRGKVNAANRVRYRVVAVLAREERARIKTDASLTDAERTKELTRLDGIATIMAKTAARDSSLIQLLTDAAPLTPAQQEVRRTLLIEAGAPLAPEDLVVVTEPEAKPAVEERRVVPQSVRQYQMSNPFLAPDFSAYELHVFLNSGICRHTKDSNGEHDADHDSHEN